MKITLVDLKKAAAEFAHLERDKAKERIEYQYGDYADQNPDFNQNLELALNRQFGIQPKRESAPVPEQPKPKSWTFETALKRGCLIKEEDGPTDEALIAALKDEFPGIEPDELSEIVKKANKESADQIKTAQKYETKAKEYATEAIDKRIESDNKHRLLWFAQFCKERGFKFPRNEREEELLRQANHYYNETFKEEKYKLEFLLTRTQKAVKRQPHYENLIYPGRYVLWLGAKKAVKSVKALEKAMCDACGADWLNQRNLLGAVKVLYLDFENYPAEGLDRFNEHLKMFTKEQQDLILENLYPVYLAPMKDAGKNVKFDNIDLYMELGKDRQIIYADCWYKMHDLPASRGVEQRNALEQFWSYFPKAVGKYLLHHIGRESSESLLKKNPLGLEQLGAERWSERISDSIQILKDAGTIICQEKRLVRTDDGEDEVLNLQVYGNGLHTSPLVQFKRVWDENGSDLRYRWAINPRLSELALLIHKKLQGKGPWDSRTAILRDYGSKNGAYYNALNELQYAGLLRKGKYGYEILGAVSEDQQKATYLIPGAFEHAVGFLRRFLVQPMPEKQIRELAEQQNVVLGPGALYAGHGVSVHMDKETGEYVWGMARQMDEVHKERILEMYEQNPKVTRAELIQATGLSQASVTRLKKALGLEKARAGRKKAA